jgi:dephospho-CoA kinase
MPQDEKRRRADHQIDNSGELNDTLHQAKNLYQRLASVST